MSVSLNRRCIRFVYFNSSLCCLILMLFVQKITIKKHYIWILWLWIFDDQNADDCLGSRSFDIFGRQIIGRVSFVFAPIGLWQDVIHWRSVHKTSCHLPTLLGRTWSFSLLGVVASSSSLMGTLLSVLLQIKDRLCNGCQDKVSEVI